MREALEKKMFEGFLIGREKVEISILQYADDKIFFRVASTENVRAIKVLLWSFKLVLGLKINFAKSSFGAIGMSEQWKKDVTSYLNGKLLAVPFPYLGFPIGANPRCSEIWDPIIKRCESKLSKW